jgi:hypothetical protein
MRSAFFVLLAMFGLAGCQSYHDQVESTARDDLHCDHVEAKEIGSGGSRPHCHWEGYVVEGCGVIIYYGCNLQCDDECRRLSDPHEIRGN